MRAGCQLQPPPSSARESAELPAWELCCQSCRMEWPSQAGSKPGYLNPAFPGPAREFGSLHGTRKKGGRQAGRKEFGIFWSANGVSLGWLLTTLGNISPAVT